MLSGTNPKYGELALLILRSSRSFQQQQCRSFAVRRPRIVSKKAMTTKRNQTSSFVPPKSSASESSSATTTSKGTTTTTTTTAGFPPPPISSMEGEITEVSSAVKTQNFALAAGLFCFVGSIFWYSMSAVGQATEDSEDPLARLKIEAQEALEREERENEKAAIDANTQQLIEEFQRGDLDPDKILDEEEELANNEEQKKKRSWLNRIIFFWR